ncbi:MlaE family ABC transporter permease [Legionella cincinnatiensis]|uniref:ABC transporter permease n=1 Tax=Legionella cincinnatiensis TaxID=28085 RepID=A0A378IS37_9GAMM|nr:ABC transporter permease [Legionella cincinnatiensis]KTC81991.1 ABC transporter permease [Legionella cincinnatiensis]STX34774.1 ABC transporter permease [Legionella cincinnatiensis]
MVQSNAQITFDKKQIRFHCTGIWSVLQIDNLVKRFSADELPKTEKVTISGKGISHFDSAGALALMKCIDKLEQRENQVELTDFTERQQQLLDLIKSKKDILEYHIPSPPKENVFYQLGKESENKFRQVDGLLVLVGDLTTKIIEAFGNWRRFQLPSIISNIYTTGVTALPILALLSFLIGVVLAYQMGLQLQTYGANSFIAYLSGMAIFREFAPLITAIIVAGRTSSAFTAQIGSMKLNEEVDALLTMGLSPTELLVLPKVIGLLIAFPLLIFWSDLFSILGSMIMSNNMLGINFIDFLQRLKDSVGLSQLNLGLYKAPAFALLIALVGCFQGFKVEAGTEKNIGSQTTKSVVQALFLIIIADAIYSVIYSRMHW